MEPRHGEDGAKVKAFGALFSVEAAGQERPLPALTGSAKQLPWATAIRECVLAACERHVRERTRLAEIWRARGEVERAARLQAYLRRAESGLVELEGEQDCRFWIDHRDDDPRDLLVPVERASPGAIGKAGGEVREPREHLR